MLELWARARSPHATTPDNPEALSRLLDRDPGSLLVAELDGQLAGVVIAAFDGWRGSLYRLAVDPSSRRRGVGTELVREAERRLGAAGARRISAIVGEGDEPAIAIWAATGFEQDGATTRFVKNL